jgi:hypothetical protein
MGVKITQYPDATASPDMGSLLDISEKIGATYVTKKVTMQYLVSTITGNAIKGRGIAVFIQSSSPVQADFDTKYGSVDGFGVNGITGSNTFKDGDIWIKI